MEIIIIRTELLSLSIISTSLSVRGQPKPRLHVEPWLPFRNREMVYGGILKFFSRNITPKNILDLLFKLNMLKLNPFTNLEARYSRCLSPVFEVLSSWSHYLPLDRTLIYRRLAPQQKLVLILPTTKWWKAESALTKKKITQIFNPWQGRDLKSIEGRDLATAPTTLP